ncbi:MAG TPA: thioesterase domain-containing protein [Thermoanaerobaculia bacterium]|nr:thioesterase domain-containing protein [Thermoanaerobaculia bacterium]
MGGSHPSYADLSHQLGPDQPVYRIDIHKLQEQRLAAGGRPYTTIEGIAAHCIEEIKAIQAEGPYFLGGGCEGGVVAFEIAQQLQRRGDRVALLLVWETRFPGQRHRKPLYTLLYLLSRLAWLPGYVRRHGVRHSLAGLRKKLGWSTTTHSARSPESGVRNRADRYRHIRNVIFRDVIFEPVRRYVPHAYRGRLVFVQARDRPREYHPTTAGWHRVAMDGIDVLECRGNHFTILTEHLSDFAELVRTCLTNSQEVRNA